MENYEKLMKEVDNLGKGLEWTNAMEKARGDFLSKLRKQLTKIVKKMQNKDKTKERNKAYYQRTRVERLRKLKTEYETIKNERVTCTCGRDVLACKLTAHKRTRIHNKLVNENEPENDIKENL